MKKFSERDLDRSWSSREVAALSEGELAKLAFLRDYKNFIFFVPAGYILFWDIPLHNVFPLPKHKKLYYWFDFGDDWKFEIRKKGKDGTPVSGVKCPRVIHKEGPKPEQYPTFDE